MNNLYQVLENTASKLPENVALVFHEHRILYKELKEAVDRLARGFHDVGLRPGDRIAIMLPNLPHYPISIFALLKIGVTIVPVSIFFKAAEIHHQLEDAEVKGIVYWEGFRSVVLEAVQGLERCQKWMVLGEKSEPGEIRLTYLLETKDPLDITTEVDQDDTAFVIYTAGMTGRPRGAELTHMNVLSNIHACSDFLKFGDDDGVVGVLSLYHPLGLTLVMGAFFYVGARVLLVPKFDSKAILELIQKEKPTYFIGVPSMYRDLLKVEDGASFDISSLKFCLSSGDALKNETMEAFEACFKIPILEGYGLSEASPMVSFNSPVRERKAGSIGLPLPGVDLKIVDEHGEEVKSGQVGEIIVQGPNVMKGYLNRPEATKEALKEGWLYTGDLAMLHDTGYGFIVVRKKDVIVKSGFNVYPREVEKFLMGHPKIKEAVVVGVPDPIKGEEIHAFIILKENEEATQEEIVGYIKERMATYKCPSIVHFAKELPKGPTGRVVRDRVRQTIGSE